MFCILAVLLCGVLAFVVPLTVHVVPHTHDDVGWLKTVDQYYYGTKEDIYKGGVQYILDSVVKELFNDPNKTFIYVEVAYFKLWWEEQDITMHAKVRDLIKNKQLVFANGGYCSNDEATVHYTATVDQMSAGLVWLTENFGGAAEPSVAWQIDAFGHSTAQAALSAQMGLKGMFFARLHYTEYERRKRAGELEYTWKAENEEMFTSVLYRWYNHPPGFCFDSRCSDPSIVDNPASPEYNLPQRVEGFVQYLSEQAQHYRSGHIMIPMGGDFSFQNAHKYFKNLDKLMKGVNAADNGFKMVYSTPSRYMAAVQNSIGSSLTHSEGDLFPYADNAHSYWTGYYSSRPTLKGYIRDCNNMLQTCRQVEVLVGSPQCDADSLWLALSVAQHHDAITGTSKQHVTDDYSRRLAEGQDFCEGVINRGLEQLSGLPQGSLESCRLLNESYCEVTATAGSSSVTVVVYNARTVARYEYMRIPLLHPHYSLTDLATGEPLLMDIVETVPVMKMINPQSLSFEGVFKARLPALGYSSYFLQPSPHPSFLLHSTSVTSDIRVTSDYFVIMFDGATGGMKSITNTVAGVSDTLSAQYMQYISNTGDSQSWQASGAYIFRPLHNEADALGAPVLSKYLVSEQFTEIHQRYSDWLYLVTRVYLDKQYAEVEWVVGPIPADYGREIIIRYSTSLSTSNSFYTDSNGRELVHRVLNKTCEEPVAGNYYPVTTQAMIVDERRRGQFTVLTDRAQGCSSLAEGELELMLHRRVLKDDNKGVREALNETQNGHGLIAKGKHWLFYSDISDAVLAQHRVHSQEMFYRPTVALALDQTPANPKQSFSAKGVNNKYINLMTVINVDYSGDVFTYLLRLENILPEIEGGVPLTVELASVFRGKTLLKVEEKGLAGDRPISHVRDVKEHTRHDRGTLITLQPLQIRTFFATYKPSENNNERNDSGTYKPNNNERNDSGTYKPNNNERNDSERIRDVERSNSVEDDVDLMF